MSRVGRGAGSPSLAEAGGGWVGGDGGGVEGAATRVIRYFIVGMYTSIV
jgi:hypothetical protein